MDFATQRAVHDPLAALGSVPGEKRATEPAVDFDRGLSHDLDRGLARLDPLTVRPRISSRVLCAVFGLLMIAAAFGVWWLCVHTENGQSYDEIVWKQLPDNLPGWIAGIMNMVAQSWLVIAVSCALGAIGVATAVIRRRWWLVGQIAVLAALCWASTLLKGVLPRPFIIQTDSPVVNSAPSGHTVLATAAAVVLLIAVPRAARALAAVVGGTWAVLVGVSVMVGQWHRTSDVLMSILLVVGLTLIMLAFTRTSGMDDPGRRVSSVSVQIVGSVLITGGLLLMLYSAYVIWQVLPGLNIIASWAVQGSIVSSVVGIIGVTALAFGLLLALRHITAAPLSRLGLIGAPPAPPAQGAAPRGAR
ncbi:pre-pilin peptidase [Bifidobacterium cebidarum]|uniref:Pre-pilin peptidase n=2 Tax=Bifidobacterium cebidarum TaxID=2650773 RepID=A0A6I1GB48_9BIFI|nr:pre-pilin peptidase [Bifidobacterium cebidarum]